MQRVRRRLIPRKKGKARGKSVVLHIGLHKWSLWFDGRSLALPRVPRQLSVQVVLVSLCNRQCSGHFDIRVGGGLSDSLQYVPSRAIGQHTVRAIVVVFKEMSILCIVGFVIKGDVADRRGGAERFCLGQDSGRCWTEDSVNRRNSPCSALLMMMGMGMGMGILLSPCSLVNYAHEGGGPRARRFTGVASLGWGHGRQFITKSLISWFERNLHLLYRSRRSKSSRQAGRG